MMLAINPLIWIEKVFLGIYTGSQLIPPQDRLSSTLWWQLTVFYQTQISSKKQYKWVLFGDSISAHVGNSFGKDFFNFAISGMSLVSLVEQLKLLQQAEVKCDRAIVAIGTNDAWYGISDETFISLMKEAVFLLRTMGATQIVLIPAFYSTVAASFNPLRAAPFQRVDEINLLIHQVAQTENLSLEGEGIFALYADKSLKEDLTTDGVHLNQEGCQIYRQFLSIVMSNSSN
ncbi:MAG TPA: SGNH/GDSL hydrolase family protein [Kamptonema sp.]|nr:SGNH/GDSL hydrolase family protein [Kamptonema sp.]